MEIKKIFLVLVDISGYTKFIKIHKVSLIHAERIIGELLESIIKESSLPLKPHELEGDSITFYAQAENGKEDAKEIWKQVNRFFERFREKESELVSECSICSCEACANVGKLKLKAVLHYGEAVFTNVQHFQKIAGEDVILAHRLLKNSLKQDEYILATKNFYDLCGGINSEEPQKLSEYCEGIGQVDVMLYLPKDKYNYIVREPTFRNKFKRFLKLDGYLLKRLFIKRSKNYNNIEEYKLMENE